MLTGKVHEEPRKDVDAIMSSPFDESMCSFRLGCVPSRHFTPLKAAPLKFWFIWGSLRLTFDIGCLCVMRCCYNKELILRDK